MSSLHLMKNTKTDNEAHTISAHSSLNPTDIDGPGPSIPRPIRFEFEDTLYRSRVYNLTATNCATNSFLSLHTFGSRWTQLSSMSLGQISNIAIIYLPINQDDISSSSQCFDFKTPTPCTASVAAVNHGKMLFHRLRPSKLEMRLQLS